MKRLIDISVAFFGLCCFSLILIPVIFLIWKQDGKNPFYIAPRVGKNEKIFDMIKLRSMKIDADKSGVDSTSSDDKRITSVGQFVRKYKLDEITQLWNVLKGEMSIVGPRPNVKNETDLYTKEEYELLSISPGITDFSSIVFSDEGQILEGTDNPDLTYNQLIRPWKSRLGLIYINNRTVVLDFYIIYFTLISIISKEKANKCVSQKLKELGCSEKIIKIALRADKLLPFPPPGSDEIVISR
jgi:lipopolysaccharide/colanic/teichoic acid biosynthesis glycosyltransferase